MTCGGVAHPIVTTFEATRDDEHRIVTGVPAFECEQCGEILYDDVVVEQLEELLDRGTPVRMLQSPLYDFAAAV